MPWNRFVIGYHGCGRGIADFFGIGARCDMVGFMGTGSR